MCRYFWEINLAISWEAPNLSVVLRFEECRTLNVSNPFLDWRLGIIITLKYSANQFKWMLTPHFQTVSLNGLDGLHLQNSWKPQATTMRSKCRYKHFFNFSHEQMIFTSFTNWSVLTFWWIKYFDFGDFWHFALIWWEILKLSDLSIKY